jgi:hypothetical protein
MGTDDFLWIQLILLRIEKCQDGRDDQKFGGLSRMVDSGSQVAGHEVDFGTGIGEFAYKSIKSVTKDAV